MAIPALMRKLNRNYFVVYIVLLAALIYIGFLASFNREGIFYAGDQALKSLEVKQIAAGYGFKYLHLSQPDWVWSAWNAGYSPLRPPFFYPSPNGYVIVYPPLFQIISAFFYSKLGSTGLYILPLLSTLILLIWTAVLLKQIGITPVNIALAIVILVFCSPLIIYGVLFWEHLPAVLLLFAGLAFIVRPPSNSWGTVALGLVTSLAIWFRPEAIMMNFGYCLAAMALYLRERKPAYIIFVAVAALSLVPWVVFNKLEYGSIFGVHGSQVLYDHNASTRMGLKRGLGILISTNHISIRNFFYLLLLAPIAWRLIRRRETDDLRPWLLIGIVIGYSLLTPFMLPNNGVIQWGARYFLAIVPVTVVLLFLVEQKWQLMTNWKMPWWLTLFILLGGIESFYHNTHGAYKELRFRYDEHVAAYNLINRKPGNVIIVSDPFMVYDFAWVMDKQYFFAESGDDSLRRLLPILKKHGVRQFIYVFDPRRPTVPRMLADSVTHHYWVDSVRKVFIRKDLACKVCSIE